MAKSGYVGNPAHRPPDTPCDTLRCVHLTQLRHWLSSARQVAVRKWGFDFARIHVCPIFFLELNRVRVVGCFVMPTCVRASDHNNDYCGYYKGMRLCYGRKTGSDTCAALARVSSSVLVLLSPCAPSNLSPLRAPIILRIPHPPSPTFSRISYQCLLTPASAFVSPCLISERLPLSPSSPFLLPLPPAFLPLPFSSCNLHAWTFTSKGV